MIKYSSEFIKAALELADSEHSKISERERDLYGLSSIRQRNLINNLCSKEGTRYLEIGVYRGATLLSAIYGNPTCKVVGIESFKYEERELKRWAPEGDIWPNMKTQLYANIDRYKDPTKAVNLDNISIIEGDFKKVDLSGQDKFNICFFDVSPVNTETYVAFFEKIFPHMEQDCILVFSNYSNDSSSKELNAVKQTYLQNVKVEFEATRLSSGLSDSTRYYSGLLIMHIKKPAISPIVKPAIKVKSE